MGLAVELAERQNWGRERGQTLPLDPGENVIAPVGGAAAGDAVFHLDPGFAGTAPMAPFGNLPLQRTTSISLV
jgi:hypothetical protein